MLSSPKDTRTRRETINGRLARSDEHSPSFAVSGSESGHAVQVRERAKDSGVQVGQSLALQEIEAGSVDGREVDGNGTARQKENQGGGEGCRNSVSELSKEGRAHVWNGIENDSGSGCGLFEHQGRRAQEDTRWNRSGTPRPGADRARHRGRLHDRRLGYGFERHRQAVHRHSDQVEGGGHGGERTLGDREENLPALDERSGTGREDRKSVV